MWTSENGAYFNEQDFIQNTWSNKNVFIPPESVPLFRGYPYEIVIQNNSEAIKALFSKYAFTNGQYQINGNEEMFNESLSGTLSIEDENSRISSVAYSFENNHLTAIRFGLKLENGTYKTSPCFGVGFCSSYNESQSNPNEFLMGFAGKVDEVTGYIVELTLNWVTVSKYSN